MPSASAACPALIDIPQSSPTRRPRLLIDAARHGLDDYRSSRDLPRLLGHAPRSQDVVPCLAEIEERLEQARLAGDPGWSCLRHVEVLIALLAERALRQE